MEKEKLLSERADLLSQGAQSYVAASSAILYYEREVQRICRDVMKDFLGAYSSILGVVLRPEDIVEMAGPKRAEWNGSDAWLGAKIAKDRQIPGIRWWGSYCALVWSSEDPKFSCCVGEWFPNRKAVAKLADEFGDRKDIDVIDNEISIYKGLALEQANTFEPVLRGLFQKWIGLWTKAGGRKGVFKNK